MSTSNMTALRGDCPAPFLAEASFGSDGYVGGRLCAGVPDLTNGLRCCLPCPSTDWVYSDNFELSYKIAEGISVGGLAVCLFLLVSWIFLPVEKTRRHYLSVCLVIGAISLALGFVVPLAAEPELCYDEITPNDMYSSLTCAWSGAFIIAGGLSIGMWIFIRALSMHLQICWDVMPGRKFFYLAQGFGWGIVAALFTTTITLTGVSFRFGDACHVNSDHSMADFWGPLLGMAGASAIVQLATFGYCINVYLKNMWADDKPDTQSSAGLPSYTSSFRSPGASARAVYRRVRKVLWLQWRGIVIVVFILIDVVFFSVVFVYLNNREREALADPTEVLPWVVCLMENAEEKEKCFAMGQGMLVNQATVTAILLMLSLAGLQCWMLLMRWSMVTGWVDYFRQRRHRKREFVSLDARRFSSDARAFEMLKVSQQQQSDMADLSYTELPKEPATAVTTPLESSPRSPVASISRSPVESSPPPRSPEPWPHSPVESAYGGSPRPPSASAGASFPPDYFGKEIQRPYHSPSQSFSVPRPPNTVAPRRDWGDPRSTFARGGLSMHPVAAVSFQAEDLRNLPRQY